MKKSTSRQFLVQILCATALTLIAVASIDTRPAHSADLLSVMSRYEGMHEIRNRKALKAMLQVDPRRTPWCGAMMTYAVKKIGRKPPAGSLKAASWKHYGRAVKRSAARRGDVAVVRGGRHVIAFSHWKGSKACGKGGNTSNRVAAACYSGVVAVRR